MTNFLGIVRCGILSVKREIYWEIQLFSLIRDLEDGITFFRFEINWNRYKYHHSPSLEIEFIFLNLQNSFKIYQRNYDV